MINDPLDPKSRDRKLKRLSRQEFRRVAKDVADEGLQEYQANRNVLNQELDNQASQDSPDAHKGGKSDDSYKQQLVTNNLPVVFVPVNHDTCNTDEEKAQFNSGLINDATALVHLVKNNIDTRHYFQGVLSLAAFKDDIKTVRAMVEGTENLHAPLSPTYSRSNALFNAVLGGGKKTTDYLLQAGADPADMLKRATEVKRRNPTEAARMKSFAALYQANSKVNLLGSDEGSTASLNKFGITHLKI